MTVWLTRAGRNGEHESKAIENNLAIIGWQDVPDMTGCTKIADISALLKNTYPDDKPGRTSNSAGQLNAFALRMKKDDLVILPFKTKAKIAVGKVVGDYQYRTDLGSDIRHTRPVQWLETEIPRNDIKQDLLYSLGAFMTVCRIERNNAEKRFQTILKTKVDPGYQIDIKNEIDTPEDETFDLTQAAKDQIAAYIISNFKGHALARLVDAILRADGYLTEVSPPGADGGVDIQAAKGSLGFDGPKLCVQVKSQESEADVKVFRELVGTMQTTNASNGLLVCWGGFKNTLKQEARSHFYSVRLWDSRDLINALERNYDKLDDTIQAELPLKRIWTLVVEE